MADRRNSVQWYTKQRLTLGHDHPGELCDQDIRRLLYLIAKLELPLYLQGKDGWIGIEPGTTANAAIQALDDLTTETYDFSFRLNGAAIWTDSDGRIGALTARDSSIAQSPARIFGSAFVYTADIVKVKSLWPTTTRTIMRMFSAEKASSLRNSLG